LGEPYELRGYRRVWNVAMDNSVDLPAYKYYVDADGKRPDVKVTFVNLVEAPDAAVRGVVLEVDLDALDPRERNYARREVEPGLWAYVGTTEARTRYEAGPSVVSLEYLELVRAAFPAVERPTVPVWDLRRVDLA
jgi:hypothetical protein